MFKFSDFRTWIVQQLPVLKIDLLNPVILVPETEHASVIPPSCVPPTTSAPQPAAGGGIGNSGVRSTEDRVLAFVIKSASASMK